jgi:hypothetical protein
MSVSRTLVSVARRALWAMHRPPLPVNEHGAVYVHLGCGSVAHPRFINVDARPAPHVHHVRGIDKLSCFQTGLADLIYVSHALEHFSHLKTVDVLTEWRRVLKDGGILRLSVPDFDRLLTIYHAAGNDVDAIAGILMGQQDYALNFHFAVFTRTSLTRRLLAVGFREVREWAPNSDELTTFGDYSSYQIQIAGAWYPVSLNLEAVK